MKSLSLTFSVVLDLYLLLLQLSGGCRPLRRLFDLHVCHGLGHLQGAPAASPTI
jgi:hypothetical protein